MVFRIGSLVVDWFFAAVYAWVTGWGIGSIANGNSAALLWVAFGLVLLVSTRLSWINDVDLLFAESRARRERQRSSKEPSDQ